MHYMYRHPVFTPGKLAKRPFRRPDSRERGAINRLLVRLMVNERWGRELDQQAVAAIRKEGLTLEKVPQ